MDHDLQFSRFGDMFITVMQLNILFHLWMVVVWLVKGVVFSLEKPFVGIKRHACSVVQVSVEILSFSVLGVIEPTHMQPPPARQ
jgi:hypothetical protein